MRIRFAAAAAAGATALYGGWRWSAWSDSVPEFVPPPNSAFAAASHSAPGAVSSHTAVCVGVPPQQLAERLEIPLRQVGNYPSVDETFLVAVLRALRGAHDHATRQARLIHRYIYIYIYIYPRTHMTHTPFTPQTHHSDSSSRF
jgi:hypothetical protein